MKATDADMNELIRGALKLHTAAMADADTWPRVVDLVRASARRRRRRRVAAVVALALAVALAAGTAVVASASRDARQLAARVTRSAAQAVGISLGGSGRAPVVTPTPGFRVVGPAYLPPDLDIHSVAYSPGRTVANGRAWIVAIYTVGPAAANEAVQSTPDPARLRELGQSGLPTVDEIFSSSKGPGYVEILQRPQVAGDPVPAGDIVALGATVGFVVDQGNETIVTLVSSGVRIQLVTNLGRSEAIRIAESLR